MLMYNLPEILFLMRMSVTSYCVIRDMDYIGGYVCV